MTLAELLSQARIRLGDTGVDLLWPNAQLSAWANEAHMEACRRLRYLSDDSVTQSLVAGQSAYAWPEGAIFIRRARLTEEDRPLQFTSYKALDEFCPGWEDHSGTPTHIFTDLNNTTFNLYPSPDAAGVLKMLIIKEPEPLTGDTDLPSRLAYGLVDWICGRAYQVNDADTFNPQKSAEHFALFDAEYGPRSSARDEVFNLRNRPFDNFDGDY
ncbi:MAG: hypothetical protein PHT88_04760 [Candidatus Moranbacteria bacterium]|nr:hypothetical protein [Candidatus Moranbacteria bacterium]